MDAGDALKEIFQDLGYAKPVIYAGLTIGFFNWLDESVAAEAKDTLARAMRLKGLAALKELKREEIAASLVAVFDRLYGAPLFGIRAFSRSLLFTVLVTAVAAFEWRDLLSWSNIVNQAKRLIPMPGPFSSSFQSAYEHTAIFIVVSAIACALLTNILSDYVSLFFIRGCLARAGKRPVLSLVIATLSALLIVELGFKARHFALYTAIKLGVFGSNFGSNFLLQLVAGRQMDLVAELYSALFVLPAIVVFVWLPLFAFGILAVRGLAALSTALGWVQWFLKDGNDHPLKAVGYLAGLMVFGVTIAWQLAFPHAAEVAAHT